MKAVVISRPGPAGNLIIQDRETPTVKDDQVLIQVKAAGVNRPDIYQRMGGYPAPEGVADDIPGLEIAGEIIAIGEKVKHFKKGDKVCALVAGAGYAERVSVSELQVLPIPKGLDYIQAASLPETFFTVWSNIFDRGQFKKGETVLVHGGSSGIGVCVIQLIKAMGGKVYCTAGTDEKCEFCINLGADIAINYKEKDFEKVVKEAGGVDLVLDMVGGDYTQKNINVLHTEGRLILINAMQDSFSTINMKKLMVKRILLTGSTLRNRSKEFKGAIAKKLSDHVWPLIEAEKIKPIIFKTFPYHEATQAHQLMESSRHIGKIVLIFDL